MAQKRTRKRRVEPKLDPQNGQRLDMRLSQDDRSAQTTSSKKTRNSSSKSTKNKSGTTRQTTRKKSTRQRAKKKTTAGFFGFLRKSFYWSCVLSAWALIFGIGFLAYHAAFLPPTSEWHVPQRPPNVKIVSATGTLLANRGDTGGESVRLEQLPSYLPNAVIAIEDRRFRSHFGIDPLGLVRAVAVNLTAGRLVQGGSTLTQQLAKNLFLEQDRTLKRKMQELVLSIWLEAKFSKNEILELYLNRVYLGAGAYGVDAASRRYFGKSARMVTIAEAAILAGLLKAPSRYSPARNPDLAKERSRLVLAAMREEGYITRSEETNALKNPAKVVRRHTTASANYVADWVMDLVPHYVGALDTDIIVDTTIDPVIQTGAETALKQALKEEGTKLGVHQGAVVVLDTAGAVKAMVGGKNYAQSQFNRAVYAKRQPGSAFKPFVYLSALEDGMSPQTILEDRPVSFKGWSPQNYSKQYFGQVTLTKALSLSLNTIAAQLTYLVGPKKVIKTAKRLGITSELKNNLSLSLGTSEVTPLEIASAYVPFSNGGYGVIPHVIRQIRTREGKILYARKGDGLGAVVDSATISKMNGMMVETLITGTGKKAQLANGRIAGGKTGTSQDFRDAWFIGYTGNLTAAVWLGNDNNSPTKKATGGSLPTRIWRETMETAHQNLPLTDLPGTSGTLFGNLPGPAPAKPGNNGQNGELIRPAANENTKGPLDFIESLF